MVLDWSKSKSFLNSYNKILRSWIYFPISISPMMINNLSSFFVSKSIKSFRALLIIYHKSACLVIKSHKTFRSAFCKSCGISSLSWLKRGSNSWAAFFILSYSTSKGYKSLFKNAVISSFTLLVYSFSDRFCSWLDFNAYSLVSTNRIWAYSLCNSSDLDLILSGMWQSLNFNLRLSKSLCAYFTTFKQ